MRTFFGNLPFVNQVKWGIPHGLLSILWGVFVATISRWNLGYFESNSKDQSFGRSSSRELRSRFSMVAERAMVHLTLGGARNVP